MLVNEMIKSSEIRNMNEYKYRCREIIGKIIKKMGKSEDIEWM
jgi:hypothetical protein